MEVWKPVVGFESHYEVSSLGRIRSLDREVYSEKGSFMRFHRGRILKLTDKGNGYLVVNLGRGNRRHVHRVVAEAFLPNNFNLPCINHKDENPKNNKVSNLEWCTHKYNSNYGTAIERKTKKISKPVRATNIKSGDVIEFSSMKAAHRAGFDESTIAQCCRGVYIQHNGYVWEFIEEGI
uniref:HNH homing endonuclease n=1 Tax=Enterococcus phage PMBT56 TaxID=3229530 RepID=A0AB39C660_9CAUD